jgi:hypothetical protein
MHRVLKQMQCRCENGGKQSEGKRKEEGRQKQREESLERGHVAREGCDNVENALADTPAKRLRG